MSATSPAAPHDPYAALRYRDYRLYLLGWTVAVIGADMQSVAVGYELYQRTGDPLALGLVGLVQVIPTFLLALPAGQLADYLDRRRIAMVTILGAALCSIVLGLLSLAQAPYGWIYLALGANATITAFGRPARAAMLPQIVPRSDFANAVTWNTSAFQIASVVGPAIGGFVLAASVPAVYFIDAACAVVLFASLAVMSGLRKPTEPREPPTLRGLIGGVKFVWRTKIILATITLDMFAVLLGGATALLPVFAERLGVGPVGLGWMRAAPAVGAVGMAVLLAHLPPMRRPGRTMLLAVAAFGAATIVLGLSQWFALTLAALVLTGAFDNVSVVVRHTLVQTLTPDQMRGRVSAVNSVFIGASNQLGALESGLTAKWFGPVISVVAGGIGTILVVLGATALWPKVIRLGPLHEAAPEEELAEEAVEAGKR
jgi:MFS family permease